MLKDSFVGVSHEFHQEVDRHDPRTERIVIQEFHHKHMINIQKAIEIWHICCLTQLLKVKEMALREFFHEQSKSKHTPIILPCVIALVEGYPRRHYLVHPDDVPKLMEK